MGYYTKCLKIKEEIGDKKGIASSLNNIGNIYQSQVNQSLKLQMQTALMEYTAAIEHYENQKQNLDLAENIRDLTEIKFQQGVASSTDLTMAENQYSSTQSNYIQAMFRLLNAKSNLDKTAGQLL